MKKIFCLLIVILALIIPVRVNAQDRIVRQDALPQVSEGLPDPGDVLGSVGSLYQANYVYGTGTYDTYLYPKPESPALFAASYSLTAAGAGYTVETDKIDSFDILRIYLPADSGTAAILFYDYQGYMLFMVPVNMAFTPSGEAGGPVDPAYMIELGLEAIGNEDYEAAVRYLIRAAGNYIRTPQAPAAAAADTAAAPTETPEPNGPSTYVVQDGDTCWGIAVDKFGVNFELFMMVNGMTSCNIGIGDEVIIPGADQQMPTMTPIPLDKYTTGQQIQYVVEMNDSYNDIASKFNTTLTSIQQLNNVNVYTGFPQYGQILTIAVNLVTPTPLPEPTATPEVGTLAP